MERRITYTDALNEALDEEMRRDPSVFVLGEDVGGMGGLFQVTRGLLDEYGPERVIDSPISEAAIAGAGVGASLVGTRPVIEFQFSDFMTIAMDQIVNHAAKMSYMTGGRVHVPLVMRAPGCGGVGMGAQHSQSLEAWFAHVPGLIVIMPSTPRGAKGLLKAAIRCDNPVVFLEQRRLYTMKGPVPDHDEVLPIGVAAIRREGTDVTVVATGRMVGMALAAARKLSDDGVEAEVIDPQTLKPLDTETILGSIERTKRLVIVSEGCRTCGYAAEIAALAAEQAFHSLQAPVQRVTTQDAPMPVSRILERELLPNEDEIVKAVKKIA